MGNKFCHNCGTQIHENAKFCAKCGFAVITVNSQPVQQPATQITPQHINSTPILKQEKKSIISTIISNETSISRKPSGAIYVLNVFLCMLALVCATISIGLISVKTATVKEHMEITFKNVELADISFNEKSKMNISEKLYDELNKKFIYKDKTTGEIKKLDISQKNVTKLVNEDRVKETLIDFSSTLVDDLLQDTTNSKKLRKTDIEEMMPSVKEFQNKYNLQMDDELRDEIIDWLYSSNEIKELTKSNIENRHGVSSTIATAQIALSTPVITILIIVSILCLFTILIANNWRLFSTFIWAGFTVSLIGTSYLILIAILKSILLPSNTSTILYYILDMFMGIMSQGTFVSIIMIITGLIVSTIGILVKIMATKKIKSATV